ncbi:hypothetical protein RFI_23350 [Reticulomyxa filosa]|uniref:Uncharacterized protein n=1 Tax=Reticulomyxa filosa TaxID=46433 RepID=X6MJ30_RETFI|nr:hypothetical protein RFI_23350 [Reticulomyxa filosa]|eukprot:ETO14018.1 hypothetical protein RFI_23350 [Reticulomyxa filosa]
MELQHLKITTTVENASILKPMKCPFISTKLLFLDVDGVLLTLHQQQNFRKHANHVVDKMDKPQHCGKPENTEQDQQELDSELQSQSQSQTQTQTQTQGEVEQEDVRFDEERFRRMKEIYEHTQCDIVVSSSWQFYEEHLQSLVHFLVKCGWKKEQIHRLVMLLPNELSKSAYEKPPYCKSRAQAIVSVVTYWKDFITHWAVLDDLPLSSANIVYVPEEKLAHDVAERLTGTYLNCFRWSPAYAYQLIPVVRNHFWKQLHNSLFSWRSCLFGYEICTDHTLGQEVLALLNEAPLNHWIDSNDHWLVIFQSLMNIIHAILHSNQDTQGLPAIASYFVHTDQLVGLSQENTSFVSKHFRSQQKFIYLFCWLFLQNVALFWFE